MDANSAELHHLVKEVTKTSVEEVLTRLGIDATDPLSAQKDFQALRELRELLRDEDFQADLQHLRRWRLASADLKSKSLLAIIGIVVSGLAGALILGIKSMIGNGP